MNPGDIGGRGPHPNDPDCTFFSADHMPLPQPHEGAPALYMLLDVTTQTGTRLLAKAKLREVQAMGVLSKANGLKVIAPPLAARGLSALSLEQLQYLFWNLCQKPPAANYGELVQACYKLILEFPEDATPLEQLQLLVSRLPQEVAEQATQLPTAEKTKREKRAPATDAGAVQSARPKAGTLTGKVWEICDQVREKHGSGFDWKAHRSEILATCVAEGINNATATTQFSKYKVAFEKGV